MKPEKKKNQGLTGEMAKESHLLEEITRFRTAFFSELGKVIIGQKAVLEEILIALLARGHLLLLGVPGLGKTRIVRTFASLLDLKFRRIQFTPDLMPADILGTEILQEWYPDKNNKPDSTLFETKRKLVFEPGPVFANLILADEINRTPPKTQAALLEAMQEHQVTIRGESRILDSPFFVLATQNPIEQEGTYPLPEAQLDRFLFCSKIDYPQESAEETEMVLATTSPQNFVLQPILSRQKLIEFQELVTRIPVPRFAAEYAVGLVRKSRPQTPDAPEYIRRYVSWGAGPRAGQGLIWGAKAKAALRGEPVVCLSDIQQVAVSVLRHRLVLNYLAPADNLTVEQLIEQLVAEKNR